jgi:hypothetical protein
MSLSNNICVQYPNRYLMRRLQLRCIKRGEKTYVDYIFYSKIVVNDFGVIETYENEGHVK